MLATVKLALRNLIKDKGYFVLNIIGLTIAFSCVFAVITWIKTELSYDKNLPDADRIYRLTFETTNSGNTLHFARCFEPWVSQIPEEFPQVEQLIRLSPYRHTAIKIDENKFYSERVFATDSNFFSVFGIDLVTGDTNEVLNRPKSAVISASVASRCFGNRNPVGQSIFLAGEYDTQSNQFMVTGVMKDSPVNSHIHFDVITSFDNPHEAPGWAYVYLLLKKGSKPEDLLKQFPAFIDRVEQADQQKTYKPFLQKISDIHLYSDKDRELEQNGNITRVYLFIAIAAVLLAVSLINFFNLNKARLYKLHKQITIQRIAGSGKGPVVLQSLFESGICVVIALIIALNLIDILVHLSVFSASVQSNESGQGNFAVYLFVLIIPLITIISGSLPVMLHLAKNRKQLVTSAVRGVPLKSGFSSYAILMTIQFCLSICLLIATLTIFIQKQFIFSTSMGKASNEILVFKKQNWEIRGKYSAFKTEALKNPLIKSVTASMDEPGGETMDAMQVDSPDLDTEHKDNPIFVIPVDDNFIDFFNLKLIAGQNFSQFNPERKGEDYILNETAVKKLGWTAEEAIGRRFRLKFDPPDIIYGGTVVGVVRDFTYTSVKQQIKPYVLFQKPIFYLTFLVKIDAERKEEAISFLRDIWNRELPGYPFQYEILGDLYNTAYSKEISQSEMTALFSVLSLIIICIGLFSITSLFVAQRTKEIGIRKVNGGRTSDILILLNSGFIKWLIIAFVVACPLSVYAISKWLQGFTYKTEIRIWVFIFSGAVIALVTLLTVTLQSLKAAMKNPVDALRYE